MKTKHNGVNKKNYTFLNFSSFFNLLDFLMAYCFQEGPVLKCQQVINPHPYKLK